MAKIKDKTLFKITKLVVQAVMYVLMFVLGRII
jgi:hypothetical protein